MANILGLTLERCSGAALFTENEIVFASSEERFSRKKSDESYPFHSINAALKNTKLSSNQLDKIVIGGKRLTLIPSLVHSYSNFSVEDNLKAMSDYWFPNLIKNQNKNFLNIFSEKIDKKQFPFNTEFGKSFDLMNIEHPIKPETDEKIIDFYKQAISTQLNVEPEIIENLDHHTCHATYGFYGSPIRKDNTIIITMDAWGDDLSCTVSTYNKSKKKIERKISISHKDFQLGRIYRYVTLYLRMLPSDHEYKVMGLAPYYTGSNLNEVLSVFEKMQKLDNLKFTFNNDIKDIFYYLENNLKKFRFDQIAAGIQEFTERILVKFFSNVIKEFNSDTVVFSGGLSMNVKANLKISNIPKLKKFFVCGGGGDESLSIGACYAEAETRKILPKSLETMYLGEDSTYSKNKLNIFKQFKISEFKNVKQITDLLLQGKSIAICRGKGEMGPRALGNRSIIADPRTLENVQVINRMIKNRDFWMPFAPIIIREFENLILKNPKKIYSPHMTMGFETIDDYKIPAAVHQYDKTARAQILEKKTNPILWDVINDFYSKTGVPAILNTSFNLHGHPLVNSVEDAHYVFINSGLEVLWLNNHIIEKKNGQI